MHKILADQIVLAIKERCYPSRRQAIRRINHENEAWREKEMSVRRFDLGRVVATPGALEALEDAGQLPGEFLSKHVAGDWGEVEADDRRENENSIEGGFRILSAYKTAKGASLWVITEADRSSTCVLLPDEY